MDLIFINYRRGPHSISVSALAERLGQHFGQDLVFLDTRLRPGGRYPDELRDRLNTCAVLVAIIHTGWVRDFTERQNGSTDWVEFEIATALTAGKTVIQVLLEDAAPPTAVELPPRLQELALRQACRLRSTQFAGDVDELIRVLERHVQPGWDTAAAAATEMPKQPRTARLGFIWAMLGWAALFSVITLPQFLATEDPLWMALTVKALLYTLGQVLMVPLLLINSYTASRMYRWERRLGALSARSYAAKSWGVAVLMVAVVVMGIIDSVNRAAELLELADGVRIFAALAGVVLLLKWLQRHRQQTFALDQAWPPVVTSTPAEFRRAAQRLRERLTTSPAWRHPRPRRLQEQAVAVYLRLAEVRLQLAAQCEWSWRRWLAGARTETKFTAIYSGWALVTTTMLVTAFVARWQQGAMPIRAHLGAVIVLTVITLAAAAAIAIDFRTFRRRMTWLTEELGLVLAELGPLVFIPGNQLGQPAGASTGGPPVAGPERYAEQ